MVVTVAGEKKTYDEGLTSQNSLRLRKWKTRIM